MTLHLPSLHNGCYMKLFSKLPFYAGVFALVLSVMVATVQLGTKGQLSTRISASTAKASLALQYSPPDLVSVSLNSEKDVDGVDVVIRFDKNKVAILPSTLTGTENFSLAGASIDNEKSTFSFSALPKKEGIKIGLIATFRVAGKLPTETATDLELVESGEDKSVVLEKSGGSDILTSTTGVTINVSSGK